MRNELAAQEADKRLWPIFRIFGRVKCVTGGVQADKSFATFYPVKQCFFPASVIAGWPSVPVLVRLPVV